MMIDLTDYAEALAELNAAIDTAADEIHHELVQAGLDEADQSRLMREAHIRLDAIRAQSVGQLDQAFAKSAVLH
jgi:hypothetical protein